MTRSRSLAEQSIDQSIVEGSAERARNGGSRTLAQHALDQEACEILARRGDRQPDLNCVHNLRITCPGSDSARCCLNVTY